MDIRKLTPDDSAACQQLFKISFDGDEYYSGMGYNLKEDFPEDFVASIDCCLKSGMSLCMEDGQGKIVAFVLAFDYNECRKNDRKTFDKIFGILCDGAVIPMAEEIHVPILTLKREKVTYLLSVAVLPEYRRQHIATTLVRTLLRSRPGAAMVSDVSNPLSLPIYRRLGFRESEIDLDYVLVVKE